MLWGWGKRAGVAYLALSVPVLGIIYQTMDALPAALGCLGIALAVRQRQRSGGLVVAGAMLAKLWPVVLLPGLLVWSRRRAVLYATCALILGVGVWVVWGGSDAPMQVVSQRHAPGWQVESTVGTIVWIFGDGEARFILDSPRVGSAPTWAKSLLLVTTALGVAATWRRARRRPFEVGAASLAAVALLIFLAPIFSYPYVLWLLPWAAIAFSEERKILAVMAFAVVLLTLLAYAMLDAEGIVGANPRVQFALLVRNMVTGAIPVVYLVSRGTRAGVKRPVGAPGSESSPVAANREVA